MTPAEFHAVMEARVQDRKAYKIYEDDLNAKLCEIIAKAPYIGNPWEKTPEDFRIMSEKNEDPADMTPESIMDRAFKNLSKAGG